MFPNNRCDNFIDIFIFFWAQFAILYTLIDAMSRCFRNFIYSLQYFQLKKVVFCFCYGYKQVIMFESCLIFKVEKMLLST